jgi:hypothetical protein
MPGQNTIKGTEYQLAKIFSSDFQYSIPRYQRPYAWTEEETGTLFDDLYDFYTNEDQNDNYFLGSLVLIKSDNDPESEVIDGQQRLTTLTILLSVLASRLDGSSRRQIEDFFVEPGNEFLGLESSPRLFLRSQDQEFFNQYVQKVQLDELLDRDLSSEKSEAQQHIQNNARTLIERVNAFLLNDEAIKSFVNFLMTRCYLVAVSTPNAPSAYRIFSVMNSRGLDLLPTDIIKANIMRTIEGLNANDVDIYTDKWEELEENTGRDGLNDLLGHTRMIYAEAKAKKTLLEEFNEHVMSTVKDPRIFIDNIFVPYADAFCAIRAKDFIAKSCSGEINTMLGWLNRIDNSDWYPPAIQFLSQHIDEPEYVKWFFIKLERLAAYMHATSKDINRRIERYARVIREDKEREITSLDNPLDTIELSTEEKQDFILALDGEIYKLTPRRRNYIILRLDSFCSTGAATYDPGRLTIEHVLPQTVNPKSQWAEWWPNEDERDQWLNRIANLVPLEKNKNSAAQNYDFDRKKKEYFTSKSGTSAYNLTTTVLAESEWKPETVNNRQIKLLSVFKDKWDLRISQDTFNEK